MLEDSHDHAKSMGRPNKKVITRITENDPPIGEDQSLEKDAPQDLSSSKASEAEEQRLKELEEQALRKLNELKECRARARVKFLKQRIEEAKATLRELNEQLQSASHKVILLEEPNSTTKASQEKNSQKSFISIDTISPLSINLQLAQWPLGYKFNMIPIFDGQSDPRQFLMSFEAAVISRGGDKTTLVKSLIMAIKGQAQQ